MRTASILLTAAALLPFVGCTAVPTMSAPNMDWLSKLSGNDEGPPAQVVAMWTDASLKKAGTTGVTRGFGGRIYFYDAKKHSVKAEGELVVYAFVERDRQIPSNHADRKFVFSSEELQQNYTKTALGHCYDVWLPWTQEDDRSVSVSLLPALKMADGKVVLGSQSLNVLKGKDPEGAQKTSVRFQSGVQQVSYESDGEAVQGASSRRRMSIYDPQTNVTTGQMQLPTAALPGAAPGAMQTGFDSDLPLATGVSTTTFDLPKSMALSMKKAPPGASGVKGLSDRYKSHQQKRIDAATEPSNGAVFDLAQAASLDRRAKASQSQSAAQASTESLARLIAAHAGAVPAVSGNASTDAKAADASAKDPRARFSPSQRKTPAWTRNHARWRQD
ncbi:MAG TPA: hypothetical protein VGN57_15770 [Pirellulaceae bacterium]|jgi:hypothetical protein|nr:hypothetical protein [Pirellulaceae bacterium]